MSGDNADELLRRQAEVAMALLQLWGGIGEGLMLTTTHPGQFEVFYQGTAKHLGLDLPPSAAVAVAQTTATTSGDDREATMCKLLARQIEIGTMQVDLLRRIVRARELEPKAKEHFELAVRTAQENEDRVASQARPASHPWIAARHKTVAAQTQLVHFNTHDTVGRLSECASRIGQTIMQLQVDIDRYEGLPPAKRSARAEDTV